MLFVMTSHFLIIQKFTLVMFYKMWAHPNYEALNESKSWHSSARLIEFHIVSDAEKLPMKSISAHSGVQISPWNQ